MGSRRIRSAMRWRNKQWPIAVGSLHTDLPQEVYSTRRGGDDGSELNFKSQTPFVRNLPLRVAALNQILLNASDEIPKEDKMDGTVA